MHRLKEKYNKEIIPEMKKIFGYKNNLEVPKLEKAVINVGLGSGLKDSKFNELVQNTLERISGQKPVKVAAKKSISGFKIRAGMIVGTKVTLRGLRMYDFIDKLISVTLPRVRDFRGLKATSVDKYGNLNIGFKEHVAFPEIKSDEVERVHGLEIAILTSAKNKKEGSELFKLLGVPFSKE